MKRNAGIIQNWKKNERQEAKIEEHTNTKYGHDNVDKKAGKCLKVCCNRNTIPSAAIYATILHNCLDSDFFLLNREKINFSAKLIRTRSTAEHWSFSIKNWTMHRFSLHILNYY